MKIPFINSIIIGAKEENGFTLIELVIVTALLAILSAIGIPGFVSIINEAIFSVTKTSLNQSYKSCQTKPDESIPIENIPGVIFNNKNCSEVINANINNECTLSMNMLTGERNNWPNSYNSCFIRNDFRTKITSNNFVKEGTYVERNCSAYAWVDGSNWNEAQANAKKIGGNLATINDADENDFLMDIFNKEAIKHIQLDPSNAHVHLHIGLTKTVQHDKNSKFGHGWVSGESSSYRPPSWGVCNSEMCGMGTDPDGNFTSMILDTNNPSQQNNWNDATLAQTTGSGAGLAEIPIPSCN